jgi:hypothetical protein
VFFVAFVAFCGYKNGNAPAKAIALSCLVISDGDVSSGTTISARSSR